MTSFTLKVYKAVLSIPLGQTRTYQWVARKAGSPKASRAVGQALTRNPWPLLVPCHRVVASRGKLGGYAWGIRRKKALLELERQIAQMML